jgi:hypothetical protein
MGDLEMGRLIAVRYVVRGRVTRLWEWVRLLLRREPRTILKPETEYEISCWVKRHGDGDNWGEERRSFVTPSKGDDIAVLQVREDNEEVNVWGVQLSEK